MAGSRRGAFAGPLGSLALSVVRPNTPSLGLRTLRWQRDLGALGVHVPLFASHDLGLLLACPNEQLGLGRRCPPGSLTGHGSSAATLADALGRAHGGYLALIQEVAGSEAARRSAGLRLGDDVVVVLLARLLRRLSEPPGPGSDQQVPLDAGLLEGLDGELPQLFRQQHRDRALRALDALQKWRLYLLTLIDALDLDTLRLFGVLGGDSDRGGLAQVDLMAVLETPEANDVVDFSLDILPGVLEAKARAAASTHAAFGYAGLSRKGNLDNLLPTELAWDPEELERRLLEKEVLYYAREQSPEQAQHSHLLLIDGSASMRGERATFARGMAIATAKKLLLRGEEVVLHFFDARLYEAHHAHGGRLPVATLLGFKGERGRNPARVFAELARRLELATEREHRRPTVHLFTHAALHIPRDTVQALKARARLTAVFMLPSTGEPQLDYLDLLDRYWVVDHRTLSSRGARAQEARRILDAETEGTPTPAEGS